MSKPTNAGRTSQRMLLAILAIVPASMPGAGHAAPPVPGTDVPVTAETLISRYVAEHPGLRTDAAFARDWTATLKCQAWTRLSDDEFRAAPFLRAGAAELAADRTQPSGTYVARFKRTFGSYDQARQAFALSTFAPNAILGIAIKDYRGEGSSGQFDRGCAPTSGLFPLEFDIKVDNPSVANGIFMPPAQAEAFARSRTNAAGTRDIGVVVVVTLRLTTEGERPARGVVKGMIVSMRGHITDVTVEDDKDVRTVLYHVPAERMRAGELEAATMQEDARREAAAKPVNDSTLSGQLKAELAQAHVGSEPTRMRVGMSWTRRDGVPGQYTYPLLPGTRLRVYDTSLRFDNAAEVAALAPNPMLLPVLAGPGANETFITYVPVGAVDDPLKEERTVIGHVTSVDNVVVIDGVRRFLSTPTSSPATALNASEQDKRLAGDFEVAGFRTSMSPTEVIKVAKEQFGQALTFDEATATVRSPREQCALTTASPGEKLPLGLRCLVGTFLKATPGGRWTLAQFQLTQTTGTDQSRPVVIAARAKYGREDLSADFTKPDPSNLFQGNSVSAMGWGARLTDVRSPDNYAPFPLHPLELVGEFSDDVMIVRFTVTDWAAMQADSTARTDGKAAEAKRASDAAKPKF